MSGQDAEEDGQLLSSKRVGGYIYQLVGYPKTQTSAATQSPAAPQASATSAMPATVSEDDRDQPKQTARKTLGPRFKVDDFTSFFFSVWKIVFYTKRSNGKHPAAGYTERSM